MGINSEITNMELGLTSKPFYLKSPSSNIRPLIVAGLMLMVLGIANPLLLIPFLFFIVYAVLKIRECKSETNIQLGNAIESFSRRDFNNTLIILERVLSKDQDNSKAKAMLALIEYERGNYKDTIILLKSIPEKYIKPDIDLMLKLGDSFVKENMINEAKIIYENMLKSFPKSEFLKDKLNRLKQQ